MNFIYFQNKKTSVHGFFLVVVFYLVAYLQKLMFLRSSEAINLHKLKFQKCHFLTAKN